MRKAGVGLLTLLLIAAVALAAWSGSNHGGTKPRVTGLKALDSTSASTARRMPAPSAPAVRTAAKAAATSSPTPTPAATLNPKHKTVPGEPGCGDSVTKSIQLTVDLLNCPGDGLIIGANNITIDLAGFTIDGAKSDNSTGINNSKGFTGVTVQGGEIKEFDTGLAVGGKGTTNNSISGMTFTDNNTGITFSNGHSNSVTEGTFDNDGVGIVVGSDSNTITNNDISNARPGISLAGNGNQLSENSIRGGGNGISGTGDHNNIVENDLEGGAGSGIVLLGSGNTIDSNDIKNFGIVGIWLQQSTAVKKVSDNTLSENDVSSSGQDGILVDSDDSTIDSNSSLRNGGDGIATRGANPLIKDNDANGNGGHGINASGGVRGSGNSASGNNAGDCSPSELCA